METDSSNQPCSIDVSIFRANLRGKVIVFWVEIGVKNHIDEVESLKVGVLYRKVLIGRKERIAARVAVRIRMIGIIFSFCDRIGWAVGKKSSQFIVLPASVATRVIKIMEVEKLNLSLCVLCIGGVVVGKNIK